MASGNPADGEGHRQERQAEGEGNSNESDPQMGKSRCQHSTTASAKHQPKRADKLRCQPFVRGPLMLILLLGQNFHFEMLFRLARTLRPLQTLNRAFS
jgi:hypothetical protein